MQISIYDDKLSSDIIIYHICSNYETNINVFKMESAENTRATQICEN